MNADLLEHDVDQPNAGMQQKLPDHGHGDQGRRHRQEVGGAIEGAPERGALDQKREAEPQKHRARHDDEAVDSRIAKRLPEDAVGEQLFVVSEANEIHGRRAELPVGERQHEHGQRRPRQKHDEHQPGRRDQRLRGAPLGGCGVVGRGRRHRTRLPWASNLSTRWGSGFSPTASPRCGLRSEWESRRAIRGAPWLRTST